MQLYQVDSFTSEIFSGNPAAVCLLDRPVTDDWMQKMAAEMNLSETAFVEDRGEVFGLRWFTPKVEVDLCGHATLATAHVLYSTGRLKDSDEARFDTRSGRLTCACEGEWIRMDFPADYTEPQNAIPELNEAIGIHPIATVRGREDYLVEIDRAESLSNLTPDMRELARLTTRGVIVTAKSPEPHLDFVSRFFAPAAGIDEDPVTGSAHCTLATYWARRLKKTEFEAYQASARGGRLRVRLEGERVYIMGQAVTVFAGEVAT